MLNGDAMTLARDHPVGRGGRPASTTIRTSRSRPSLSGRLRFVVGEEEREVGAGESVRIPGGVPHRVEALEDSLVLDVFAPRREDWLRGDDAYLRG